MMNMKQNEIMFASEVEIGMAIMDLYEEIVPYVHKAEKTLSE